MLFRNHLHTVFCAFVIFCGGLLFGMISDIEKGHLEIFFAALSGLGTVGLLGVGIFSYFSWKKHTNYGYLYQSAKAIYLNISECSQLYITLYMKLQNRSDKNSWVEYFSDHKRTTDINRLQELVKNLTSEMQTLEIITSKDDFQRCSEAINTYSRYVIALRKDVLKIQSNEPEHVYSENVADNNALIFVSFRRCEMNVKEILNGFIANH